jgi:hypothetical protein
MVLGTVRREAGPCERRPKTLKISKLAQGGSSGSSPLRLDGSRDGQAGWTSDTTHHAFITFYESKAYNLLKVSFLNIEESFILRYA